MQPIQENQIIKPNSQTQPPQSEHKLGTIGTANTNIFLESP